MKINNKAQEARNDLLIWYVVCIVLVLVSVSALYGFGFITSGARRSSSLMDDNEITGAVTVQKQNESDFTENSKGENLTENITNNTKNINSPLDSEK